MAARLVALVIASVALAACTSTTMHTIVLRDGRRIRAFSTPELMQNTGYYRYRTEGRRDALVRADEVLRVERG